MNYQGEISTLLEINILSIKYAVLSIIYYDHVVTEPWNTQVVL